MPGNLLLGVVAADGKVAILPEPPVVDDAFVEAAQSGRPAESRFRFAGLCHQGACNQWANGRCTVIDRVVQSVSTIDGNDSNSDLPACAIRSRCRWYARLGAAACETCPMVVTDTGVGPPVQRDPTVAID